MPLNIKNNEVELASRSLEEKVKPRVSAATYEDVDILRERDGIPVLVSRKE